MIADKFVHLVRFERTTFPFGGERSNPTELQVREVILSLYDTRRNIQNAEGTGVEPVRACAHWFSKPTHYRPAHPPKSEPGAIRTRDLLLRKQLLYPAELRTHKLTSVYFTL